MFASLGFCLPEILGDHRKLHPVETSCIGTHTSNISQRPPVTLCGISHTHPHLVLLPHLRFQITFLPSLQNNSQAAVLLTSTSTSKLLVFSRYSTYIVLIVFTNLLTIYHMLNCAIIFIRFLPLF